MKKVIALLLALCMVLGLVACGNSSDTPAASSNNASAAEAATGANTDATNVQTGDAVTDTTEQENQNVAHAGQTQQSVLSSRTLCWVK